LKAKKKVLIITYYWPPAGGAGVQRWLKFAKYLGDFGWEPIIYTPENPDPPSLDDSLLRDIPENIKVLSQPIWEPYAWYRSFVGQKDKKIGAGFVSEEKQPGLLHKIAVWVRGNIFIPDARRFWIKPSIRFLTNYLKGNPVDVVVSTGPPHSMHMIGLGVKKNLGTKWVADFRDPWTNIDFYKELMLSDKADKKHRQMEQKVLKNADLTLTIGYTMTEEMKGLGAKRVETLTNGFDEEDFTAVQSKVDEEFSIAHIGTFSPSRNHNNLWKALSELKAENEAFAKKLKIRTVGVVDHTVRASIESFGLNENWEEIAYVPHNQVLKYQQSSKILLVCINNTPNAAGILPGKFFEYLASGRPILAIGPVDGDIGKLLAETQAGAIVEPDDLEGIKTTIRKLFTNSSLTEPDRTKILNYSRRGITERLAELMDSIAS